MKSYLMVISACSTNSLTIYSVLKVKGEKTVASTERVMKIAPYSFPLSIPAHKKYIGNRFRTNEAFPQYKTNLWNTLPIMKK